MQKKQQKLLQKLSLFCFLIITGIIIYTGTVLRLPERRLHARQVNTNLFTVWNKITFL
jgi:hypothetical protein